MLKKRSTAFSGLIVVLIACFYANMAKSLVELLKTLYCLFYVNRYQFDQIRYRIPPKIMISIIADTGTNVNDRKLKTPSPQERIKLDSEQCLC